MSRGCSPHAGKAAEQWRALHHVLLRLGAYVHYLDPQRDNPDQVFTANGGLVRRNRVVLSRFRHPERQGEEAVFRHWFECEGFEIAGRQDFFFEGEGDALFAGSTLLAGYGIRSQAKAYDRIAQHLEVRTLVLCELVDPHFYHLDLVLCPLRSDLVLCYEGGLTAASMERLRSVVEVLRVPYEEACQFVCNSIVLGHDVVMPARCPRTISLLESLGFFCHVLEVSEFLKGGGAVKCMVLHLDRW